MYKYDRCCWCEKWRSINRIHKSVGTCSEHDHRHGNSKICIKFALRWNVISEAISVKTLKGYYMKSKEVLYAIRSADKKKYLKSATLNDNKNWTPLFRKAKIVRTAGEANSLLSQWTNMAYVIKYGRPEVVELCITSIVAAKKQKTARDTADDMRLYKKKKKILEIKEKIREQEEMLKKVLET